MGAWGPGLYSDDFALDLRTMVGAVARLPLAGDELVDVLASVEPAATDPADPDHLVFWLVVADQLQRRGIDSKAREQALGLLDAGKDLERLRELEMAPADLRKRERRLARLAEELRRPPPAKERRVLRQRQPLLLERGELLSFPVDTTGNSVNPYFPPAERSKFQPVGWGALVVLDAGHAFDYLAWYHVAVGAHASRTRPDDAEARRMVHDVGIAAPGTLTKRHREAIHLGQLGRVDEDELPVVPPSSERQRLTSAAGDISIVNYLRVIPTPDEA